MVFLHVCGNETVRRRSFNARAQQEEAEQKPGSQVLGEPAAPAAPRFCQGSSREPPPGRGEARPYLARPP